MKFMERSLLIQQRTSNRWAAGPITCTAGCRRTAARRPDLARAHQGNHVLTWAAMRPAAAVAGLVALMVGAIVVCEPRSPFESPDSNRYARGERKQASTGGRAERRGNRHSRRGRATALYEVLMRRYNERILPRGARDVRDEDEAEDVMQQAYVNAYAHCGNSTGGAKFSTWLTKIAIHEALAGRASRAATTRSISTKRRTGGGTAAITRPEQQAFAGELRSLLESSIDELPDGLREVFMLREVDGLNTANRRMPWRQRRFVKDATVPQPGRLRNQLAERAGILAPESFRFPQPAATHRRRRLSRVSCRGATVGLLAEARTGRRARRRVLPLTGPAPRDILDGFLFPGSPIYESESHEDRADVRRARPGFGGLLYSTLTKAPNTTHVDEVMARPDRVVRQEPPAARLRPG